MTGVASFPLSMNTGKNIEKTQPLEINKIGVINKQAIILSHLINSDTIILYKFTKE